MPTDRVLATDPAQPAAGWAPRSCTLPTPERPVRRAEFDAVFARVSKVERPSPTTLRVELPGDQSLLATVDELAARESQCCSFFSFDIVEHDGVITMCAAVDAEHIGVLDALAERAVAVSGQVST